MKILIGTPIHEVKDYCIEEWLKNVAKLQRKTPADLLLVDNSPTAEYIKKVDGYLKKYDVKNYQVVHLAPPKEGYISKDADQEMHERIAYSREIIRDEILSKGYDAWFSWECDQIIPQNSLNELIRLLNLGDFMIVYHNSWARDIPNLPNVDGGMALIKKKPLEEHGFILKFGTDPEMPDNWAPGEIWFKKTVLRDGGNYAEVYGIIDPIYHLDYPK